MKFLITGATGLVGNEILRICAASNIDVHFLTTSKSKIDAFAPAKGFYWNPSKKEIDTNAFDGVTQIIHLAGATVAKRWTESYKKKILNSRITTANLIYSTLQQIEHTIQSVVSASAIGIYPDSNTEYFIEDSKATADNFLSSVVCAWEQVADQFQNMNIPVCKLRIGLVLAKNGGALPKLVAPVKFGMGAAFGTGKQWQSWIHLHDLAQLFVYAAKNQLNGVFNAVAPNPVTQYKLLKACAQALDKPLWLPNIPAVVPKMLLGEMSTLLLASQRVSSNKIEQRGFQFEFPLVGGAVQHILEHERAFALSN